MEKELLLENDTSQYNRQELSELLDLEQKDVSLFCARFKLNLVDIFVDYDHVRTGELFYTFDDGYSYDHDGIFYSLYEGEIEELELEELEVEE